MGKPKEAKHIAEGSAVDYDAEGKRADIEILDGVKRFAPTDLFKNVTLEYLLLTCMIKLLMFQKKQF